MPVLGVGIVTLDIVNFVEHYPAEDEELRAQSQHLCRGGNAANTLSVLSQFGHQCFWAGTLANDNNAALILDDFSQNKINTSYGKKIKRGKQPTSTIHVNMHNGSRTIVHFRDLPELDYAHFKTLSLAPFNWVHFEARAIEETAAMVKRVKKQSPQITVSVEIEKPRDNLQDILGLADVYLFSKAYANAIGFRDSKTFLNQQKQLSPQADLICTWGEEGAYALLKNGAFLSTNAFPPKKVIDTLGAGDTFNAALIHSRLNNKSWEDALVFSCQLAGKKCGQKGFNKLVR